MPEGQARVRKGGFDQPIIEALSSPDTPCEFTVTSVLDLSTVLIQARIAAGWIQKQLAEAVGTTEQQIQRCEATRYEGISLKRAKDISKVLNVSFHSAGQHDKSKRASEAAQRRTCVA